MAKWFVSKDGSDAATTLNDADGINGTDTTIVMTSGTNFSEGDYICITAGAANYEIILLGTKSTNTFSNCTRAQMGTSAKSHSNGASIYFGGCWANPKLTIQAALNIATTAGDEVYTAPGVYNEILTDPAQNGTSSAQSMLMGDVSGTIADGGSNYHGVTAAPVVICKNASSTNLGTIHWDTTSFWTLRGFVVSTENPSTNDNYRAIVYGNEGTSTYGEGAILEDCIFIGNSWVCTVTPKARSGSVKAIVRRCISIGATPFVCDTIKATDFSSDPDIEYESCVAIPLASTASSGFGAFHNHLATGSNYTYSRHTNCVTMSKSYTYPSGQCCGFTQTNSTYCKIEMIRCLSLYGKLTNGTNATEVVSADTDKLSYYYQAAAGGRGTQINPTTTAPPQIFLPHHMLGNIQSITSYTGTNDLFGTALTTSIGAVQYVTGGYADLPRTAASGEGATKLWSLDYPNPDNVTEDDTVQGVTGQYHEPTEAEVQSGVQFGADGTEYTGEYSGGGGSGGTYGY